MKLKNYLTPLAAAALLIGCANDSTSDLTVPEPIGEVTYTNSIKAIVDQNCISCHADTPVNGAPMPLTTYAHVKDAMLTRPLLEKISKADGEPGLMPNGGPRMPQSKINKFITWQAQGLLE